MKTHYYRYAAVIGYLGLLGLLILWNTVLNPLKNSAGVVILVLPLLLPSIGFLKGNLKSCAWTAYSSLIYFIHGTGEAYSNADERFLASLEVFFSLLLFFSATFYVRLTGRAEKT